MCVYVYMSVCMYQTNKLHNLLSAWPREAALPGLQKQACKTVIHSLVSLTVRLPGGTYSSFCPPVTNPKTLPVLKESI